MSQKLGDLTVEEVSAMIDQQVRKAVAEETKKISRVEYLQERQKLDLARFASASQWLIASLLAVNSAGAIFAGDSTRIDEAEILGVVSPYLAGAILALVAGHFYRQATRWHLGEAALVVGKAKKPKRWYNRGSGDFSETEIATVANRWDLVTEAVAWLSLAAFLLGSYSAYVALITTP